MTETYPILTPAQHALLSARHHNPFEVLGRQLEDGENLLRVHLPHAVAVWLSPDAPLQRLGDTALFEWRGEMPSLPYQLQWQAQDGTLHTTYDPYSFPSPLLTDFDLHLFAQGQHFYAQRFLGAHPCEVAGIEGVRFAVWAPNAQRVSVVGDFNQWDGRIHQMRVREGVGIWELFIPQLPAGTVYKYEISHRETQSVFLKADPYAQGAEKRPNTASYVVPKTQHQWTDQAWLEQRAQPNAWLHQPMSIYEVHLGSWQRHADGEFLSYRELAEQLIPYVKKLGFTHLELLPVSEHPLDASWGYQTVGFFAPTSRYGSPDDLRYFIDQCHQNDLGVLLDWVPGHFPKDAHGLAWFDGTALYEYADPRQGEHRDWGTLIFNYGRNEVRSFLISNALYWLSEFHIDGLRVDAVASILYLDYSRQAGEWIPNQYGGNENLEAIDFLRQLNSVVHQECPGVLMIAEESTSWPQVTRPTWVGGLGFNMKWNMGWMHDTLTYMSQDPVFRAYHHQHLTFGMLYAFSENFVLPFSHDEVVHGKRSLLDKMPGDMWQRFANLRLLFTYQWTYPGKKLLFMGGEFAHGLEWNEARALEWSLLDYPHHSGMQLLVSDLNQLYRQYDALHRYDFEGAGFSWVDCHDAGQSVIAYMRRCEDDELVVILNFTPVPRHGYRIGVYHPGLYREIFNSDAQQYGGSHVTNSELLSEELPWMNQRHSITVTLPPLAGIVLQRVI
jgi:1,4-alpha-glucan branching enzyme